MADLARKPALGLTALSADEYVRSVLPHSAELWAGERSFDAYAEDFRALANSGFGRRPLSRARARGRRRPGRIVQALSARAALR